jgi:hypothetical protein
MILEVADDPDTAVNEEQDARLACCLLWRHDVQFYCPSILRDRLFDGRNSGHIDRCFVA